MSNLVTVKQLSRSFGDGELTANGKPFTIGTERKGRRLQVLDDVSLTVAEGEMLAIIGASGSGKSTLLHCLGGLDHPDTGEIIIAGQKVTRMASDEKAKWRNQQLGFIYQFHHLLAEFTALENVALPLLIAGEKPSVAKARAFTLLERVGLTARAKHYPAQLSGGERQRVAIVRALANQPRLVLADEPTGNLDEATATLIYQLMVALNQEFKTAFIVVTHDKNLAAQLPRQLVMQQGKLLEGHL